MTGKFGTQEVLVSHCEWDDFTGVVFVDEQSFMDFFSQDMFLKDFLDNEYTLDDLMDEGLLGYTIQEVIGT